MQAEHVESIDPIALGAGSRVRAMLSVAVPVPIIGLRFVVTTAVPGRMDAPPAPAADLLPADTR